jgi:hypothetical protein
LSRSFDPLESTIVPQSTAEAGDPVSQEEILSSGRWLKSTIAGAFRPTLTGGLD